MQGDGRLPDGTGLPMNEAVPSSPTVGIPDADDYDDWHDDCCYECGGEGFVSDCVEEWACVDPEYGCDYCTRRCPLCNPAKPRPEICGEQGGQDGNCV